MEIYNQNMELIENPDMELGYLKNDVRIVHHNAVQGVEQVSHYEVVKEYPTGGRILEEVIDVPGVQARDAWDEEIPIHIYVPYTQEELDAIEAEKNKPTTEQRIAALEEELAAARILLGLEE